MTAMLTLGAVTKTERREEGGRRGKRRGAAAFLAARENMEIKPFIEDKRQNVKEKQLCA